MRHTNRLLPLFTLSILLGCGADGPGAEEACALHARTICVKRKTCWTAADYRFERDHGTVQDCEAREKVTCLEDVQRKDTGTTASRVDACAKAREKQTCEAFLAGTPLPANECPEAIGPRVDGKPCVVNNQCASGYCNRPAHQSCGTCGARQPAGGTCDQNADCASGLSCQTDMTTMVAACAMPPAPAPRAKLGEACGGMLPGCEAGLECVGMGASRTCQAVLTKEGEACDPMRRTAPTCEDAIGLHCNPNTKLCEKRKFASAGEPCGTLPDGTFAVCRGGAACVRPLDAMNKRPEAGTCVADVGEGTACSNQAANGPGCLAPLRCVLDAPGAPMGKCRKRDDSACGATGG